MSKIIIWIIVVVILGAAIILGVIYINKNKIVPENLSTSSTSTQPSEASVDISDEALNQDLQALDNQLNALDADIASSTQGINDLEI